ISDVAKNLEVWILPADLPASPGTQTVKNYNWSNPAEVGTTVLAQSTKMNFEALPTATEKSSELSFKIDNTATHYLFIKLAKDTPFHGGYKLVDNFTAILATGQIPRSAKFMFDGVLLSSKGSLNLNVVSHGIPTLDATISRILPDQVNSLLSQSN